ncbi:MAG TPA: VOC family protein [Allosphingosinicella sp.]|nr:VOC family protein [Allosphingosinicella sp.]
MTSNILQVTPFMHVPDLEAALAFMTGILGFSVGFRQSNYAYVSREGAGLRILEVGGDPSPPATHRFAYYFDCRDVDSLHAELKPKLDLLPAEDVHGPADKPYRQRELLVKAPDGNLIVFGQSIA